MVHHEPISSWITGVPLAAMVMLALATVALSRLWKRR